MSEAPGSGRALSVAYVIGSYPLLTTTFIDREIAVMRSRGVDVQVISLRRPQGLLSSGQSVRDVHYARPASPWAVLAGHSYFFVSRPVAYLATLWRLVSAPHSSLKSRLKTLGHFALGVHVARLVHRGGPFHHVHAHFVDRAAAVALVVGRLLGLPYSATAHANDIYVDPVVLERKVSEARFVATCTGANADHLRRLMPGTGRILCIHHGLDVGEYECPPRPARQRPLLLAVGQLKEKKGFTHLIEACRLLAERGMSFRCEVIGEGPLREGLERAIAEAGLSETVALRGALPHEEVAEAYAAADVFVLPCVTGRDGDRDGIPNVILEAMASGLPVVSTDHSGIPEAVHHGNSGLLVPPGDASALADALATLIEDGELRRNLGEVGRKLVAESFDLWRNVDRLIEEFAT